MRKLCDAGDIIQAHLIRHALEDQGIPVYLQGEHLLSGIGELPALGLLAIWVPEAALARAAMVVQSLGLQGVQVSGTQPWADETEPRLA